MNATITPGQIEQFQQQGFVVLEDFLDTDEIECWREMTGEAVQQRLTKPDRLQNQTDPNSFYAQVFTQCLRLADTHAGIAKLVKDPRLGQVAATLTGVNGVRMWHDQALIKQPYANQTAWHLDDPYWAFYSQKSVNMWFALDDATLANGCLWYLPGTHKLATYDMAKIGSNMRDLFKIYPDWEKIEAIPTPCRAGSVVIHNGLIAHAAGANMTPFARRAMTTVYFPDGELYNGQPDTLPKVYYETLSKGDVLDDDRYLPLIWKQAKGAVNNG